MKPAFTKIVGNRALCESLAADVLTHKLPHAFILEGKRGSGKHTIAQMAAAALACTAHGDPSAPLPCLCCDACKKILERKSPDVILIGREEDKLSIGIQTIRFLREDVRFLPNDEAVKIYVIEEADRMTEEAQNAFLLTLEEPPSYVYFFLLCESASALLETIRSRAPILRTEPIPTEQIDRYLSENDRRAAQMKLAEPARYRELLCAADMSIGLALDYLEPHSFEPILRTRASISEFLEAAIRRQGAQKIIRFLLRMPTKRDTLQEHLNLLSLALRDLLLLKKSDQASLVFFSDRESAIELCDATTLTALYRFYEAVGEALQELKRNANVRLTLTKLALSAELI